MNGRDREDHVGGDATGGHVRQRQRRSEGAKVPSIGADRVRDELRRVRSSGPRALAILHDDRAALPARDYRTADAVRQCPGASATLGHVDRVRRWVADDANGRLAALDEREVHGVERRPRREVARPADRVDQPVRSAIGWRLTAPLLADHAGADRLSEEASNGVLDREVSRRRQISPVFSGDLRRADGGSRKLERPCDGIDRRACLGAESVGGPLHGALRLGQQTHLDLAPPRPLELHQHDPLELAEPSLPSRTGTWTLGPTNALRKCAAT